MSARELLYAVLATLLFQVPLAGQQADSVFLLTGIVYNASFEPLSATHVINLRNREGDVTDSLGIFQMRVNETDTLLILNISYEDTLVVAAQIKAFPQIVLKSRYYELEEARIFEWGSTYQDFREAIIEMPNQQSLGASLGLPRQDPDYVPLEMDPRQVKSPAYLISSPISFFYQNFNKNAKSARKVYWMEKNREKMELFSSIVSADNLSSVTGLIGDQLLEFQSFLNSRMKCDFHCTELELYTEIYALWDVYRELHAPDF
jgi:hypothetical protein